MFQEKQDLIGTAAEQRRHIDALRARGLPTSQAALDALAETEQREALNARIKAENEKARADAKAAEETASLAGAKAALKARLRQAYMVPGVTEEDFERDYPELEKQHIKNSALERMANDETAQSDLVRRKRDDPMYAL